MNDIKKMKLYRHPERVYNELDAAGYKKNAALKAGDMTRFDQYHYFGTDAVDDAICALDLGPAAEVIDIGSGIGGPARYMAEKTGCHVTALELQPDLHQIALSLTERCALSGLVRHLCGDILDFQEGGAGFDAALSLLAFLHIPDRDSLLKKCFNILKPGGKLYIEDFCRRRELNAQETRILFEDTYCAYLPTAEEYGIQLCRNGFTGVELTDKTGPWTDFVGERLEKFVRDRDRFLGIHGVGITEELEDFYKKMSQLFNGGNVGGLRIIAVKDPAAGSRKSREQVR